MRTGGRLAAAIEILEDIGDRHRPATEALKDWGRAHRFAGSGDRAAIGNLVFDVLRQKSSLSARMGADSARALVLGLAGFSWEMSLAEIDAALDEPHAPPPLSESERARLSSDVPENMPAPVAGDFPSWLADEFTRAYGDEAAEEGAALAARAPIDLRVNRLKSTPDKLLKALAAFGAAATLYAPDGVRIPASHGARRAPNIEAEAAHGKGWFEVQDEGSQIASCLTGAAPGMQVLDLCAGAGGKTLALAGMMENKGQIHAYDSDKQRLRPIWERLKRAGVRNAQVMEAGDAAGLEALAGKMDAVLVDAPCSGSGTWRRRPDAKWRLTPEAVDRRMEEQDRVLALGAPLVKPGGRLVYVTCSVLPQENEDRIAAFLEANSGWAVIPAHDVWQETLGGEPPLRIGRYARLSPRLHQTDGFFIAILERLT